MLEAPRSEVGGTHPAFYGPEDMLDGAAADRHRVGHGFEPALHGIEYRFVFPSPDTLLLARRAQRAGWADATDLLVEVNTDELSAIFTGEALLQQLAGGAPIGIGLRLINERGLAPEAARLSR